MLKGRRWTGGQGGRERWKVRFIGKGRRKRKGKKYQEKYLDRKRLDEKRWI